MFVEEEGELCLGEEGDWRLFGLWGHCAVAVVEGCGLWFALYVHGGWV